jgi:UDP-hydrolysing UDP-N-acetyl-D-glucosamine 2-epimerase
VAVVTGSRAEFGLLLPVMRAVAAHDALQLQVVVAGAHLLPPAETVREVAAAFPIAAAVAMQDRERPSRLDDAEAMGRGVVGFTRAWRELAPRWVVVLGDRIEPFAAAASASIAGIAVAHVHGGDRAEGIADEAMRHAITKLAHLHLAATEDSAARIVRLGEPPETVHVVGSPAVDALASVAPMDDRSYAALGRPEIVFLMHPIGRADHHEFAAAATALRVIDYKRVLALRPNHDPGSAGILRAIEESRATKRDHMPREQFLALCKRLAASGGALVGNSSAGLLEGAALGLPAVNIGPRQGGRQRPENVLDADETGASIATALERALAMPRGAFAHPYGDGGAGGRIALLLARVDPTDAGLLRKRCAH